MKNQNNLYNSNVINQYSDINHKEDINYYKDYNNSEEIQIKNNRYNITHNNSINNNINYINNDIPFLGSQEKKKAHTFFGSQPGLPGLPTRRAGELAKDEIKKITVIISKPLEYDLPNWVVKRKKILKMPQTLNKLKRMGY